MPQGTSFTYRLYLGEADTEPSVYSGAGDPNGATTGNAGDLYLRTSGLSYVCSGGTGWTQNARTNSDTFGASSTWNGNAIGAAYGGTGQTTYAVGDLLYASAATTLTKLAATTAGAVLQSNGATTAPSWALVTGCRLAISAAAAIANQTATIVSWDTETSDNNGCHSTSVNPSRITVPTNYAGTWQVGVNIQWAAGSSTAAVYTVAILRNNTVIAVVRDPGGTANFAQQLTTTIDCAAGDYFEAQVTQTSGGSLNVQSAVTHFWGQRL